MKTSFFVIRFIRLAKEKKTLHCYSESFLVYGKLGLILVSIYSTVGHLNLHATCSKGYFANNSLVKKFQWIDAAQIFA